jgi:hypothetical protein
MGGLVMDLMQKIMRQALVPLKIYLGINTDN